ncbi:hypothetical protein [Mesorhizobium sp. B2-3-4]|uniref:hypothetical protein n=1 Tax=Mesorhizobium sp. B2-3-4 TaxID=2589959 RepID=UPI0011288045|nr:hypothetical protein [Mesorhizobium sp. B2-3-4]
MATSSDQHIDSYDFETIRNVVCEMVKSYPGRPAETIVREVFADMYGDQSCPADLIAALTLAAACREARPPSQPSPTPL